MLLLKKKTLATALIIALSLPVVMTPTSAYAEETELTDEDKGILLGLAATAGLLWMAFSGDDSGSSSNYYDDAPQEQARNEYYYQDNNDSSSGSSGSTNSGQGGLYGDCHGGAAYGCK